jgi:hypothetical protein
MLSHKFHGPGLKYEIGLNITTGDIVWVNGPFPCGAWPDMKIFKNDLVLELDENERVEADKGYRGSPQKVSTPQRFSMNKKREEMKARVRSRHETVNKRLKQWGCLDQVYRHDLKKHAAIFRSVLTITQLSFNCGYPLYTVSYED